MQISLKFVYNIGLGDGLMWNRWQVTNWTKYVLVQ